MMNVPDSVKRSLQVSACKALPAYYWDFCFTLDQKAHYFEAKRSCVFLAISLEIEGDKYLRELQLKKLVTKRLVKVFKAYRDYLLSFYLLVEAIWEKLLKAAKEPASIGYTKKPDETKLTEINFPFKSATEVTGFLIQSIAFLQFKPCLEECKLFPHSRAIKMSRLDHDLRGGFRLDELENYKRDLEADRQGSEEYYSLKTFCERVALKVAGKDMDVKRIHKTYQSLADELDKLAIAGQRNTKGFGFIDGKKVKPKRNSWVLTHF
jgi:hypothetical protein